MFSASAWVQEKISLSLSARVKRPGEELVSKSTHLSVVEEPTADEVDAYERLLGDAMHGDGMLFVREDAVEAAWAIVDPILANEAALHPYEPGLWGPREAERLTLDVGGWHNPEGNNESTAQIRKPRKTNGFNSSSNNDSYDGLQRVRPAKISRSAGRRPPFRSGSRSRSRSTSPR
jgi:hypothetical protein